MNESCHSYGVGVDRCTVLQGFGLRFEGSKFGILGLRVQNLGFRFEEIVYDMTHSCV